MKKIIPVIIALVLIVVIGMVSFGGKMMDKYSYGKELADMDEYYGVEEGELAIILQDEKVPEKAVLREDAVYFELATAAEYINDGFYVDRNGQSLLYTTANDTVRTAFGARDYSDKNGTHAVAYMTCFAEGDEFYVAADYLKLFANYAYSLFDRHIQVYTEWGERETMEIAKNTQIRELDGIKSPILCQMEKGQRVELLKQMEDWSIVKTADSIIGYVENKYLTNWDIETETPVTDYVPEEYTSISLPGKVSLGWHNIGGVGGNDTLNEMLQEAGGNINVIAPTWFSLTDNEGNFRSFASGQYVEKAHDAGLKVWGVWDNFNYRNETGEEVSSYQVLSYTERRQALAQNIVNTAVDLGLDGVNIDFEELTVDCGEHYIQFLRELSVLCRSSGLVLSVDNYVPFNFNNYYRLDVQGVVADYVVIMGYDEHWHGSGNPGSVASISYVSNGLEKTLEQVPAEKVVNALPFYMIVWKTDGTTVTDEYLTIKYLEDYLTRNKIEPTWDETTCQNYAQWQEGSATCQVWIEDKKSILAKLNVMDAKGIGGVGVWRIGYGTQEVWSLIGTYMNF